jgi:ABC-type molybdate transport system ATPase subunit
VGDIIPFRSIVRVKVHIGRNTLMAELPTETFNEMNIDVGSEVFAIVKLRRLRYFVSS